MVAVVGGWLRLIVCTARKFAVMITGKSKSNYFSVYFSFSFPLDDISSFLYSTRRYFIFLFRWPVFWFLFADFLILGWIGQKVVETPYIEVGQIATVLYFLFFCFILPVLGIIESAMIKHK